jgi:hypothetical protein
MIFLARAFPKLRLAVAPQNGKIMEQSPSGAGPDGMRS